MSEELLQKDLIENPQKIGNWDFYNIGATTLKALKRYKKIRDIDYGILENKKPDALIIQKKQVIAVIEYKTPQEFRTDNKKDKAIKQEIEVAKKLGAKIFIATDTKDSIWINALTGNKIKDENGNEIKTVFDPKNEDIFDVIKKIYDSINEQTDNIKPKQFVNPTNLAKSIWQDIWSVSGATPENCLYTFVELFIFKYLSDLDVLQEPENFDYLMNLYNKRDKDFVLEYYANNIRPKIKTLFPEDLTDKTTIINGTIFVSKDQKAVKGYSTTFKTVLDKFNKYGKLEHIDYDFKSQLFESFLKESISKKNWGQFFTPLKVVRSIVEMAKDEIKDGVKICDPACGVGKFLLEPLVTKLEDFYKINRDNIIPKITIHGFDKGFDKDEQKTIILAKANMLIYFSDLIKDNPGQTKDFAKLFNESFTLKTNSILGTLSYPVENEYDLILTNPPYVTSGSGNLKDEIKKDGDLVNYYKVNAMGVEGLFMEWIIRALKPGGKGFIVIPDGILNRQNDKNLRQFILDECYIDGLISLPLNTFFTTNKKTYILAITKKINRKDIQKDPVFTYLVSEIGESRDIYRFDIDKNDLREAVTLYSFFKGNKLGFEKINSDNRCKIQPFNEFIKEIEKSWIVDKWWSEKEKIEMGIIEKKEKVTLLEFATIIEDVANSMKEFQDGIKELSEKKKSKIEYKNFIIKDLFNIERGNSKYIKKYIDSNKGKYPVYSGNTSGVFAHINSFDYQEPCLSWAIDGLAGYIMTHDELFSATNHRGVLKPKNKNINLLYTKYIIEPIFRKLKKGRLGADEKNEYTALPPFMIEDIEFQMPVDEKGNLNIEVQNEVVEKIIFIEENKQKINEYKQKINDFNIEIEEDNRDELEINVSSLLKILPIPKKISKKDIQAGGKFPVFSSQTSNSGLVGYSNLKMFDASPINPLITFGDHTKVFFIHTKAFSVLDNVKVLQIKDEYKNLIDIEFLIYLWHPQISNLGYARHWKEAKNIQIKIPIDKNENFNLQIQKQIAEKYKKVKNIKSAINHELNKIAEAEIDL